MSRELYACIHATEFAAQALLRLRTDLKGEPVAILEGPLHDACVCSMNRAAAQRGVVRGLPRMDAEALNGLKILDRSLTVEQAARTVMLEVAAQFTPRMEVVPAGIGCSIVLDVRGSELLFGPPNVLATKIKDAMEAVGLRVSVVLSANFHTARLKAAAHRGLCIVDAGAEADTLALLPLHALDLSFEQQEKFELWFALADIDEYVIENNRRSTNRILTLLNHVRNDKLTQQGTRNMEGEKIRLIIGSIAQATQHVKSLLPQNEKLLIVARNGKLVQEVQVLDTLNADDPWGAIDAADSDRERFLHQLLAGVVLARRQRFGSAVTTILRGIRHTKGNLRKPFRSVASSTALQRRAIAVALLEAFIALGPELDAMTLRAAYDHCWSTLSSGFKNLLLTKIIRGKKFAEVAEKYRCEILLRTVKLTSGEEVRELRTIHQAKGTEWQNVLAFLIGRNENETQDQIKHILSPAALSDEEKRVTYVAISRARDRLFLATPTLTTAQEQEATDLGIDVTHLDAVQLRLL